MYLWNLKLLFIKNLIKINYYDMFNKLRVFSLKILWKVLLVEYYLKQEYCILLLEILIIIIITMYGIGALWCYLRGKISVTVFRKIK